jgi:hypothetical protein
MLIASNKPFMLSAVMLYAVMLRVVAPSKLSVVLSEKITTPQDANVIKLFISPLRLENKLGCSFWYIFQAGLIFASKDIVYSWSPLVLHSGWPYFIKSTEPKKFARDKHSSVFNPISKDKKVLRPIY